MHLFVGEVRKPLRGTIDVPSSKYHAHRALMLASLAPGSTRIVGSSGARHVRSTIEVLRGLGTRVEQDDTGFVVHGGPYRPTRESVSVGSSGTTLYFMIGLASLADQAVTLTGQKYFQRRPVGPLLGALTQLGVRLQSEDARPPITVEPSPPTGGHVRISGTLSQWISGLLLLAPFATRPTVVEVDGVAQRAALRRAHGADDARLRPRGRRRATTGAGSRSSRARRRPRRRSSLPPDIGSAAFGLAASALHPSDVLFRGMRTTLGAEIDHPEAHVLDVLTEMGLPMELDAEAGGVRVRHDGIELRGARVDCRPMPDMLPILATLGSFAQGTTVFENVAHVRLKESDRVVSDAAAQPHGRRRGAGRRHARHQRRATG